MVLIRTMEAVVLLLLLFADGIPSLIALYMKLGLAKANPFPKFHTLSSNTSGIALGRREMLVALSVLLLSLFLSLPLAVVLFLLNDAIFWISDGG